MFSPECLESRDQTGMKEPSEHRVLLSVISPCYNESEAIKLFYTELKSVLESLEDLEHEIIFIDDGSTDDTLTQLNQIAQEDPCVRVRSLSRNFGHQIALTAGLDLAAGKAVIMMDSDLQHPPDLIPEMIEKWRQGYDIVSAVRLNTKGISWFKKMASKCFYFILNILSSTFIPQGAADFCLLSGRVCRILQNIREQHRFLRGIISWMGFNRALVSYQAPERAAGQSKYTFFRMLSLAIEATLSFSSAPLRLAMRIGLIITLLGFMYLGWILLRFIFVRDLVPGWASLICVVLIIGGFQLTFIGLIGQYIARVFEEVKRRPMYIVKQEATTRQQPNNEQREENNASQTES